MPRGRVLLALLHGDSTRASTVPRNALAEMILGTLRLCLDKTDISKKTVRNTMKAAEKTALLKDLQYTQDQLEGMDFSNDDSKSEYLRACFRRKHRHGMILTVDERVMVEWYLYARWLTEVLP
jgi:hypothetical protein